MKKAINAWTLDAKMGFDEAFRQAKAAGFDGIELNLDADGAGAHSLTLGGGGDWKAAAECAERYGLPIVSISTSLGGLTGGGDAETRKACQRVILRQIELAIALGAGAILSVPGNGVGRDGLSLEAAWENSLRCYGDIAAEVRASGVEVCLEQVWNGFFTSPFDMARFVDALGGDAFKVYFDAGNMVAFSWPEHWIPVLGARIRRVHVKDFKRAGGALNMGGAWVDLGTGDVNYAAVVPALRAAGFDGYLTAETSIGESATPGIAPERYYRGVADALGRIIAM